MICKDCVTDNHVACKGCPCQHRDPSTVKYAVDGESEVPESGDGELLA